MTLPDPPEGWRWWQGLDPEEGRVLVLRWTPSPLQALWDRPEPYIALDPEEGAEGHTEAAMTILEAWHEMYPDDIGWM